MHWQLWQDTIYQMKEKNFFSLRIHYKQLSVQFNLNCCSELKGNIIGFKDGKSQQFD